MKNKPNNEGSRAIKIDDYRISNASKVNAKRFPDSGFYILNIIGTNYYKLGVSQNIKRRLKDIESSMPFDIEMKYYSYIKNAYNFESFIKDRFKSKYVKREWFIFDDIDYNIIIKILGKWQGQLNGVEKKKNQLSLKF